MITQNNCFNCEQHNRENSKCNQFCRLRTILRSTNNKNMDNLDDNVLHDLELKLEHLELRHIDEINDLRVIQQSQRDELVGLIAIETSKEATPTPKQKKRIKTLRKPLVRDREGRPLNIGDTVIVLTPGKNVDKGDRMKIEKFQNEFVVLQNDNGVNTRRASRNLVLQY